MLNKWFQMHGWQGHSLAACFPINCVAKVQHFMIALAGSLETKTVIMLWVRSSPLTVSIIQGDSYISGPVKSHLLPILMKSAANVSQFTFLSSVPVKVFNYLTHNRPKSKMPVDLGLEALKSQALPLHQLWWALPLQVGGRVLHVHRIVGRVGIVIFIAVVGTE